MSSIRTSCPRCKSPVVAEVEQLFDMNVDPQAKQRLLSGGANVIHCPTCGYDGMLSTPIVYHDPEKEFLLTYFPSEMGLPLNEQEKIIGPLITQVMNRLPAEKRKAYLLRPQAMLTFQTMVEKILEGDGITHEMLDEQQKRLNLLQRLLSTPAAADRSVIIKQEEALIDENFFSMFSHIIQATLSQNGDEQTARALAAIQQELVTQTEVGKKLLANAQEAQEAQRLLQEASKTGLTREKLLDLMAASPSDTRLATFVSLTRSGLDYQFFQILSERVDKAEGDEKQKLLDLRAKLLELTSEIDKQLDEEKKAAQELLNEILKADDTEAATREALPAINEFFLQALKSAQEMARKDADLMRLGKLGKIAKVIEEASAPPPEVELIEKMLSAEDEAARQKLLQENAKLVTDEFLQALNSLVSQGENDGQPAEMKAKLQEIYRSAVRFSMQANFKSA
ncbi:CpXC protein [Longilinea arvoryzae]|uniref:CpXC protein n=1 Tax=Longilinea arvoryzae TaxID=360412 RepID=A0A0S7B9P2_9CHLR|nr:CpXC domain-containing protein [Longilinea arvoryzae]GAP14236.1 CpXC protein [Longilinea arvoryzae]